MWPLGTLVLAVFLSVLLSVFSSVFCLMFLPVFAPVLSPVFSPRLSSMQLAMRPKAVSSDLVSQFALVPMQKVVTPAPAKGVVPAVGMASKQLVFVQKKTVPGWVQATSRPRC